MEVQQVNSAQSSSRKLFSKVQPLLLPSIDHDKPLGWFKLSPVISPLNQAASFQFQPLYCKVIGPQETELPHFSLEYLEDKHTSKCCVDCQNMYNKSNTLWTCQDSSLYYKHTIYLSCKSTTFSRYIRFIMIMLQKHLGFLNVFLPSQLMERSSSRAARHLEILCKSQENPHGPEQGGGGRKKVDSLGKSDIQQSYQSLQGEALSVNTSNLWK